MYSKTIKVHSKNSDMTEDYTLTRYNHDIYNDKIPKFIREQKKIIRIIKTFLTIPKGQLYKTFKNTKKVEQAEQELNKEYEMIRILLQAELDEMVIMGRTPKGEVIRAFLVKGFSPDEKEEYENENYELTNQSSIQKLKETKKK